MNYEELDKTLLIAMLHERDDTIKSLEERLDEFLDADEKNFQNRFDAWDF